MNMHDVKEEAHITGRGKGVAPQSAVQYPTKLFYALVFERKSNFKHCCVCALSIASSARLLQNIMIMVRTLLSISFHIK